MKNTVLRGVRGATTVQEDQADLILEESGRLLGEILRRNPTMDKEAIASVIFTVTPDLKSTFPAKAARQLGWTQVPLMCALEIPVQGSLEKCIRVMVHWNTDKPQSEIQHVYLNDAEKLRPDLLPEE